LPILVISCGILRGKTNACLTLIWGTNYLGMFFAYQEMEIQGALSPTDMWDEWNNETLLQVGVGQVDIFENAGITADTKPPSGSNNLSVQPSESAVLTNASSVAPTEIEEYQQLFEAAQSTVKTYQVNHESQESEGVDSLPCDNQPSVSPTKKKKNSVAVKLVQQCSTEHENAIIEWDLMKFSLPATSQGNQFIYAWNAKSCQELDSSVSGNESLNDRSQSQSNSSITSKYHPN